MLGEAQSRKLQLEKQRLNSVLWRQELRSPDDPETHLAQAFSFLVRILKVLAPKVVLLVSGLLSELLS